MTGSPISRSGAISFSPSSLLADAAGGDRKPLLPADLLGDVRDRGEVQHPDHASDLLGNLGGPIAIAAHPVLGDVGREEQRRRRMPPLTGKRLTCSAVTIANPPPPPRSAQKRSGSRRRPPYAASPSAATSSIAITLLQAQPYLRPSQLSPPPSVYPVTPTFGRGAGQEGHPLLVRGAADLLGQHARLHPGGAVADLDRLASLGLDQDRVVQRTHRHGAVSRALAGDLQVVVRGETIDLRDVVRTLDERDRGRPLVRRQVPGLARLVPVGVARGRHPSPD